MATIKAIQASSVHQIQSGQVIVDLNSVVKELVENALDAGSTSIDIRFRNNGLESIEVQDNGSGIAPEDFQTLARKHYTSKLSSYDDLDSLDTFGFRGEALSSLCALSDFHVVTATAGPKGTRLDFDISGSLNGTNVVAAQKGTTVTVGKLFKNLPVRRRELEKNIKREYAKALNLLQAYACISTNIRFSVSNQPLKGQKAAAFATKSNPSTRENILNVYGAKTLAALVPLDLNFELSSSQKPTTTSKGKRNDQDTGNSAREVTIRGHISKPVFGEGRLAPDRQMFFVNHRPCTLPQVSKAINEVYKSFNVSQSPFIFADLIMDTNSYDVNVSPDKRTILLHDQVALLESLKESLTRLFDLQDQTVPTSQLQAKKLPGFKQPTLLGHGTSRQSVSEASEDTDDGPRFADATPADRTQTWPGELISAWARRDAASRNSTQVRPPRINGSDGGSTVKIPEALRGIDSERDPRASANEQDSPHSIGTDDDPADDVPDAYGLPREEPDFKARMLGQKQKPNQKQTPPKRMTTETVELNDGRSSDRSRSGSEDRSDSEEIPVIRACASKARSGPVQNAFDRMRPKRHQPEEVEVTVGDQTMNMVLEGPESKRRRIHTPKLNGKMKGAQSYSGFTSGLALYSALETQVDEEEEDNEGISATEDEQSEDEEDDDSDGGMDDKKQATPITQDYDLGIGYAPTQSSVEPSSDTGLFVEADDSDDEYLDEDEKKAREDAKVSRMIEDAEQQAAQPTEAMLRRASQALRANSRRKDATLNLEQTIAFSLDDVDSSPLSSLLRKDSPQTGSNGAQPDDIAAENAESKLSLTISKPDFAGMRIVGQFNLGFILAIRPASTDRSSSGAEQEDHLFIIDQHAADEKFNFERLHATTKLTAQRLVTPKDLQLTAVEEELIHANQASLIANGFEIERVSNDDTSSTTSGASIEPKTCGRGRRYRLTTLPTSKETTFTVDDLEELLHLLSETSLPVASSSSLPTEEQPLAPLSTPSSSLATSSAASTNAPSLTSIVPLNTITTTTTSAKPTIVRPSRVRKMLAMRACRSSIMVGKYLTPAQMTRVVRHMGEMERPWNCPHGRPTMRHLAGLGEWTTGWDGDGYGDGGGGGTDWGAFVGGGGAAGT